MGWQLQKICEVSCMKKISLGIVSVFTLLLCTLLSACGFKEPSAKFSQEEIFLSIGQSINLDDYLSLKEVDFDEIDFKFSDSSFVTLENSSLTPTNFGQTMVYAQTDGNTLAKMRIIVKKPFEKITSLYMDDNGLVTWNKVVDKFDAVEDFVSPSNYELKISYTNEDDSTKNREYTEQVSGNTYQLEEEGRYQIQIIAVGEGYFDNSQVFETVLYFGYMPKLQKDDFLFDSDTNTISWAEVSGADYSVTFNGEMKIENLEENSLDLTNFLEDLDEGDYDLSVKVNDVSGEKISVESESVVVRKIENAVLSYENSADLGGYVEISLNENIESVLVYAGEEVFSFSENSVTDFASLPKGVYIVEVQANPITSEEQGVFLAKSSREEMMKIYKLGKVEIAGSGENEENASSFNINISRDDENVATKLEINLNGDKTVEDGFFEENSLNKSVEVSNSGDHILKIRQLAEDATISLSDVVYQVINSDESGEYNFTKLDAFSVVKDGETIAHEYQIDKSVMSFNLVEKAEKYELKVLSEGNFVTIENEDNSLFTIAGGEIIFNGKIENLFEEYFVDNKITFCLVASGEKENTISSSTTKTLTLLETPSSEAGNEKSEKYTWKKIDDAQKYVVNYAIISKEEYESQLEVFEEKELVSQEVTTAEIQLESGNYFYIEIYALPSDENKFLTSKTFTKYFFLSKNLDTPNVEFCRGILGSEDTESYYIQVENVENMSSMTVTFGEEEVKSYSLGEGVTIYRLNSDFASAYDGEKVGVVVHSTDNVIYLDSEKYELTIKRLKSLQYDDLKFDELTKNMTVEGNREGVSEIVLSDGKTTQKGENVDTVLGVYSIENGNVTAQLLGSEFVDGKFEVVDNMVYLDSALSTFSINRLDRPTEFTYNDGKLAFTSTQNLSDTFVLDIFLTDANQNKTLLKISNLTMENDFQSNFPTAVLYLVDGEDLSPIVEKLEIKSQILEEKSLGNYQIDLTSILNFVKGNSNLNSYYNQAVKVEFGLYSFKIGFLYEVIYLSSYYAVLREGSSTLLEVKKMESPVISFDKNNNVLGWESVGNGLETTYKVYRKDRENSIASSTANSYNVDISSLTRSRDYVFYVTATSPYYLESSSSNEILIHRLNSPDKVTVSGNNLLFTPDSSDNSYVLKASIKIGEQEEEEIEKNNIFSYTIAGSGVYTIKYLGVTDFESDGKFYLDSATVSFELVEMSEIAPSDNTISFQDNTISFEKFGENVNLQTVEYYIVFKDEQGNYSTIKTKENSFVVQFDDDNLASLTAGNIDIKVYAVCDTYSVSAGGKVYYSDAVSIVSGLNLYNTYAYTSDKTIVKLSEPEIENVEFLFTDENDEQTPTIRLVVKGNYTENEKFLIFMGDSEDIVKEISYADAFESEGVFNLDLTFEEYNSHLTVGDFTSVSVKVTSSLNLTSNEDMVDIYRNDALLSVNQNIASISYNSNSINGYDKTITLKFKGDIQYATGGITLKITYTPTGEEEVVEYLEITSDNFVEEDSVIYDLSSFFEEKLGNGGTIKYSAYINNFSDNNVENESYFMASQSVESLSYEILATPSGNQKTNGGIQIVDKENIINSTATKYVLTYGDYQKVIGESEDFYFEFPSTWGNGEYKLTIFAFEENKIISIPTEVSITLSRLQKVEGIKLMRDSSQELYLAWNEVTGATSYIVRAYIDETLVGSEIKLMATSCPLANILGTNYSLVAGYTVGGSEIRFDIIACNHDDATHTDSAIQSVTVSLIGSGENLTQSNITVGEDGLVYFEAVAGETYLYRLVDASDQVTFDWKEFTGDGKTEINIFEYENLTESVIFTIEIKKKGDATVEGTSFVTNSTLKLDSVSVSSDRMKISNLVREISVDSAEISNVMVALNNQNSTIFASLSDKFILEDAIELSTTYTDVTEEGNYLYYINYTEILDAFKDSLTDGENKIYFFALQNEAIGTYIDVISLPYEYTFTIENNIEITLIDKMDDTFEEGAKDYSKTKMVFTYDEKITGFYFRVDFASLQDEEMTLKYVYSIEDCQIDTISNSITLDLTKLFDNLFGNNSEVYKGGEYQLFVSVLKAEFNDENEVTSVVFSDYIDTYNGNPIIFEKLPDLYSSTLDSGNLIWSIDRNYEIYANRATNYYIYFTNASNENKTSRYITNSLTTSFNGESFATADGNEYIVSVVAVSNDIFTIASEPKYVLDSNNEIKKVAKNRFNSPITLSSSGTLSIRWDASGEEGYLGTTENDIIKLLTQEAITNVNDFAQGIFFYPFTFTVRDLVEGNVKVRFKFTSYVDNTPKKTETIDIDATYLLQTLEIENLQEKLNAIRNALTSSSDKNLVTDFSNKIANVCGGVGNYTNIFDEFFERVQSGEYKIEYCLLGNGSTFTSTWYTLTRENGEDIFYVNPTPTVTAGYDDVKTVGESIARSFYIKIKESQIYSQNGTLISPDVYYLQLKSSTNKYGIEIRKVGGDWTWLMSGDEENSSFQADSSESGYIKIYLNQNDGNSIKSVYNDIVNSNDFTFEVFSQGNQYSISSKSERYELYFNGVCHDFQVENGTFIWQSHQYYPTHVEYRLNGSTVNNPIDVTSETATLSLTLQDAGKYDYIKFVTYGSVDYARNIIRVDSETYMIEDVYKLSAPTIETDFNLIRISESEKNQSEYQNAYTSDQFKKYEIYNDVSTNELSFKYTDTSINERAYYEAGVTNYSLSSGDYAYKLTESEANSFQISTLGSTSAFVTEQATTTEGVAIADVFDFVIDDEEGENKNILLRSATQSLNARMLNAVSSETMKIENGVVSWSESGVLGENELRGNAKLVYKVTLTFYISTIGSDGATVQEFLDKEIVRYTAQTYFDISKVTSEFPTEETPFDYIRVTVQALALNISSEISSNFDGRSEELVEGGYVSGVGITFVDGARVLMSNGTHIEDITLSTPVEDLQVVDGKLTWTYGTDEDVMFIVEDETGKEIEGEYVMTESVDGEDVKYLVTFQENAGLLSSGEHILTVYAVQTQGGNTVKSEGVSIGDGDIKVIKIGGLTSEDYTITTTTIRHSEENRTVDIDVVDFAKYFENNSFTNVELTLRVISGTDQKTFEITKDKTKIVVFNSDDYTSLDGFENVDEYVDSIIVPEKLNLTIQIVGVVDESVTNILLLNSDASSLNLSRPANNHIISFDEESQTFSWQTDSTLLEDEQSLLYVVSISYSVDSVTTTRTYEIEETSFTPTIIGEITEFKLALKYGRNALQSPFVNYVFKEGTNGVSFNLFASGAGTSKNPYIINDAREFKNIAYRMSKPNYLNSYKENGVETQDEESIFYFQLGENILDLTFDGILFKGTFEGNLNGNSKIVSYAASYSQNLEMQALSTRETVRIGKLTGITTGNSADYDYGLSIFETIGNNASVSSLTLNANFASGSNVTNNILVSGLAIINNGSVARVNISSFSSNLVVYSRSGGRIGAYAGLVSVNRGMLSSCAINGNIAFSDTQNGQTQNQYFYVGGFVYTNYGNISSCVLNANITLNISNTGDSTKTKHQIAGITVTSTSSSTLTGNSIGRTDADETYKVIFNAGELNRDEVYVAGIAVLCETNNTNNTVNAGCAVGSITNGQVAVSDDINPSN